MAKTVWLTGQCKLGARTYIHLRGSHNRFSLDQILWNGSEQHVLELDSFAKRK